jgi:acyl carrier protein
VGEGFGAVIQGRRCSPRLPREDAVTVAFNLLMQILMETFALPKRNLHPDATFAELEMDSLSLTELTVSIEERTGLEMKPFPVTLTLTEAADRIDDAADAYLDRIAAERAEQQRGQQRPQTAGLSTRSSP